MLRCAYLLTLTLTLLALVADHVVAADPKKKITFDDHVLPILREKCLSCHNADKARGGLDLSTYAKTMEGGSSGAVVKPGDADGSRLYLLTAHKEEPKMPPNSPMIAPAAVDTLRDWIALGALENAGSKPVPIKPKADVTLKSVTRGRPQGPPPMPETPLRSEPIVAATRPNAVIALAVSPWAPLVAIGGQKQVTLYHTETGQLLGVLPFPWGTPTVLKFSRNGSLLLAGGGRGGQSGKVVVWSVKNGEPIIEVGNELDAVLAADISADQTMIALGGPGKIVRFYSTRDGSLIREVKKHTDWVTTIEFSPDGVLVATGDRNGGLFVWEAYTGREFYTLRGHTTFITDLSWRDDSNVLASSSEDSSIRLWEMENGSNFKTWTAHGGGTQSVKFAHDGRLVSTGRDRVTKLWDGNGTQQKAFEAFADIGLRVGITHDTQRVLAGDWTGQVRVWNVADAKSAFVLSTNPPTLAERVAQATQEVTAKQAAFDQASAAFTTAKANADKAQAQLAAVQKSISDLTAALKSANDSVPQAKAALDKASADLAAAQMRVQARQIRQTVLVEAANKLKASAEQAKTNPDLAAFATQAQQLADQATAELAAAQKQVSELDAQVKTAQANYAAAQKKVPDTDAALKAAMAQLPVKQKQVADLTAALNTAKANLDAATTQLNAAKAALDKLKATPPTAAK